MSILNLHRDGHWRRGADRRMMCPDVSYCCRCIPDGCLLQHQDDYEWLNQLPDDCRLLLRGARRACLHMLGDVSLKILCL